LGVGTAAADDDDSDDAGSLLGHPVVKCSTNNTIPATTAATSTHMPKMASPESGMALICQTQKLLSQIQRISGLLVRANKRSMIADQKAALAVLIVGGTGVVASYVYLMVTHHHQTSYVDSPLWLGMPRSVVIPITILQVIAAIGFLAAVCTWLFDAPPKEGLMSRTGALATTLAVFFAASVGWAALMSRRNPPVWAVSLCLIAAAASSIAMLAGAAEESKPRWWVTLGLLVFCLVTVLADGVLWNARFIFMNKGV